LGFGHLAALQAEGDVLSNRHGGIESIGLEDHSNVAVPWCFISDLSTIDKNAPPIFNGFQASDTVQQGGLSAPRWTKENEKFSLPDFQIDILQYWNRVILLAEFLDGQGHGSWLIL